MRKCILLNAESRLVRARKKNPFNALVHGETLTGVSVALNEIENALRKFSLLKKLGHELTYRWRQLTWLEHNRVAR